MTANIRIGIVDDHQSIREAYQQVLEKNGGFCVIGSLSSALMADLWCKQHRPDILLMDICTEEGASGLEACRRIKDTTPDVKIVLMTGFEEVSYIPRAIEAGADGFIYKSKSFDELLLVLQKVLQGERSFPEAKPIPLPFGEAPLTEREMEILRLLCKNYSRTEIAETLYISESTVKRHLRNMMEKTGTNSTVALAIHMVSGGWINPNF